MPVYAPTTDELRSELSERARQLEARLEHLDRAIDESVDDLRAIAADSETLTAERVKALNVVNRSLHASADAARKELAAAQRLLRVELPTPMEPGAFAAAAAAGQIAGISDADRVKHFPPRPGLDDLGDAGLRDLPEEELQAQRRAYYVKGSG
jgi:ABC-type transporter Mla subunit MlaD